MWVRLAVGSTKNVFLKGIQQIELPIAHAEGRLVPASPEQFASWESQGQLALQYCPESAESPRLSNGRWPYPINPNGSWADLAGLSDPTGRVLGLMPHPERFIDATQHPQWTRKRLQGDGHGLQLFRNAVSYFGS